MAEVRAKRRLAAILAADVVGYSRLMDVDETSTLAALKARRRDVLAPLIAKHQGRIFKTTGDGVLVEFSSAVNAVQCAVDLQQDMAAANGDQPEDRHIVLRIGVNLGDVMVEGSDLYGDGINIAARLESIANPGGILVSGTAYDQVKNKIKIQFDELGPQTLKNIADPVRAYRVSGAPVVTISPKAAIGKPSIAVLPFINMSGDREQQYFSDGITEDIITELSRFRSLTVIARNSSFQYRDKSVDVKQVGRDLGVEYLVEGSVRKAGGHVRITAQLIQVGTGNHLWAEHYDRKLEDIFVVQDDVVRSVVAALPGRIAEAGRQSARRKRSDNLTAYDFLLRGLEYHNTFDRTDDPKAREMLEKAIALDPDFAAAYAWLAASYTRDWDFDLSVPARDRAFELARKAVALDANDSICHTALAYVCLLEKRFSEAAYHCERAIALNPNEFVGLVIMATVQAYLGRPTDALEWLDRAVHLNPLTPMLYTDWRGIILYMAHRYAEAVELLKCGTDPTKGVLMYLVAAYGQLDRSDEAEAAIAKSRVLSPSVSLLQYAALKPFKHATDLNHLLDGLCKAGVSE